MLRFHSALLAVVVIISAMMALLTAFPTLAQQPAPSVDDCKAFPWKDKSKAPALLPGMSLSAGQSLKSSEATLTLTEAGNLQVVRTSNNKVLWQTNTQGAVRASFNGNLYLEDNLGNRIWSTNITNNAGAILQLQHDCNLVIYGQTAYTGPAWSAGSDKCLKIHIVPHSHDDVGWLLTPERYYDGCYSSGGGVQGTISTAVQCLLEDSNRTYTQVESYFFNRWWTRQNASMQETVKKLVKNGQLDFTNGGWSMHDEACVHQESAIANMEVGANFLKEQFGDALKLKIGWHIDPFGHASTTPRIMAQMGFDAFFFWRQDDQQRQYDLSRKGMETIWRSSSTLDGSYNMFTSILYNNYCMGCGPGDYSTTCPGGFCCYTCEIMEQETAEIDERHAHGFDGKDSFGSYHSHTHQEQIHMNKAKKALEEKRNKLLEKTPLVNSKHKSSLLDAFDEHFGRKKEFVKTHTDLDHVAKMIGAGAQLRNAKSLSMDYLADQYAQMVRSYAGAFRTNQVLIPWGCDFAHDFAYEDYPLMDQIIAAINGDPDKYGMELFYSSPRKYIDKLATFDNDVWPENHDDYFVYADNDHAYWSGYFTSRAEYKGYERWLMANHRAAETVFAFNSTITPFSQGYELLFNYREAMGIAQHHDSITGTERTHVRNRYQMLLDRAYNGAQTIFQNDIQAKVGVATKSCPLANLSVCAETSVLAQGQPVEIVLWNNLGNSRSDVITIPIPVQNVDVIEIGTNTALESQVVDTWRLTTTADLTSPVTTPAHKYQVYIALDLEPQAYKTIRILPSSSSSSGSNNYVPTSNKFAGSISNEYYKLTFDQSTNAISGVSNLHTGKSSPLDQMIGTYCPHDNSYTDGSNQASGAYIFRTCNPTEDPVAYLNTSTPGTSIPTQWVVGPLCQEVRQIISNSSNIQQAWRLCKGFDYVELTNGLGELETGNNGVEVIQRLSVPTIKNAETWYTDSEGLELQKRVRNFRPNYPYQVYEEVGSNFFPCNAFATLNESNAAASSGLNVGVVMDRSRAVGSLHQGELEMLIHRRLLFDDGRGVGQALNARTRVLSTSRLIFHESSDSFMEKVRLHSLRHTHYPLWFAASSSSSSSSSVASATSKKIVKPAGVATLRGAPSDPLPPNVHRHALTYLFDGSLLVRVQHLFDRAEGPLSTPVTVNLRNILPSEIAANPQAYTITETDLLGVNALAELNRKNFNSCQKDGSVYTIPSQMSYINGAPKDVTSTITLRPMEMRTFVVRKQK